MPLHDCQEGPLKVNGKTSLGKTASLPDTAGTGIPAKTVVSKDHGHLLHIPKEQQSLDPVKLLHSEYCGLAEDDDKRAAIGRLHPRRGTDVGIHDPGPRYPIDDEKWLWRVFKMNAFSTGEGVSVFADASKFNHSCRPNATAGWSGKTPAVWEVRTLRHIGPGEELCVSYLSQRLMREPCAIRRKALRVSHNFECHCAACSLPNEELDASDKRRGSLSSLPTLGPTAYAKLDEKTLLEKEVSGRGP